MVMSLVSIFVEQGYQYILLQHQTLYMESTNESVKRKKICGPNLISTFPSKSMPEISSLFSFVLCPSFLPYSPAFVILLISYLLFFLPYLSGSASFSSSCANHEKNGCVTEQKEESMRQMDIMCSSPQELGDDDEDI